MELRYSITTDNLAAAACFIKLIRAELEQELRITVPQFRTLSALGQLGGCSSVKQLADLLEVSSSALTFVCDKLKSSGLIEREIAPDNRRITNISLIPQGEQVLRRGYEACDKVTQHVFEPLGDFMKQLVAFDLQLSQKNYRLQSHTGTYLADNTSLNVVFLYDHKMHEVLKEHRLKSNEFRVLFEAKDHADGVTVSALAHLLLLKANEVTTACNGLEGTRSIRRRQDQFDRRSIKVEITSTGYTRLSQAATAVDKVFCSALDGQSAEQRQLYHKAARLIAASQRGRHLIH